MAGKIAGLNLGELRCLKRPGGTGVSDTALSLVLTGSARQANNRFGAGGNSPHVVTLSVRAKRYGGLASPAR